MITFKYLVGLSPKAKKIIEGAELWGFLHSDAYELPLGFSFVPKLFALKNGSFVREIVQFEYWEPYPYLFLALTTYPEVGSSQIIRESLWSFVEADLEVRERNEY